MEDKILLMKEAMGMSDRLFDIANAFSGDETGLGKGAFEHVSEQRVVIHDQDPHRLHRRFTPGSRK